MKSNAHSVQNLTRCSIMASLTVLFQMSIGLFPGIGHILSAAGVLPISLAAIISPGTALMSVAVAAWLTFIILPHELPLFIFCTAPLGLVLGCGIHYSWNFPTTSLIGTASMAAGMMILAFILGVPAFGPLFGNDNSMALMMFCTGFSLIYSIAWLSLIVKMKKRLKL